VAWVAVQGWIVMDGRASLAGTPAERNGHRREALAKALVSQR
jgi:hypothetical protein